MNRSGRRLTPAQMLGATFVGLIGAGTLLLSLPVARADATPVAPVDALFTATSAVCVTGLIVLDTPAAFSTFGHVVLLLLIKSGGLGYMVVSTALFVALGRRPSLPERMTLQESLNLDSREDLLRFTWTAVRVSLLFELAGAILLAARWWSELGPARAAGYGVFHAVSAFNNAGFALFSDSLIGARGDLLVNAVVAALFVTGGLGFLVVSELSRLRYRPGNVWRPVMLEGGSRNRFTLSVHTRLVLSASAVLGLGAALVVFALERGNPETLGPLPLRDAWLAAVFQSLTTRTAGFNTIDIGAAREVTLFLMMALMFIGASPGGTGGGIKTTTFVLTLAALWATVRGQDEPVTFGRRLAPGLVARAFFIAFIAFLSVNVVAALLLMIEVRPFLPTLFEVTSAFGTVGLSTGLSGTNVSLAGGFSIAGKLLVILMMFVGRIGPLTVAVALARRRHHARVRYPEARVPIG